MKKITALVCLTALILTLFASCGKAPDFIPMEKGSVTSVNWTQGGSRKDINNADIFDALADAYNSATETSSFKEDGHEWSVAVVCGDERGVGRDVVGDGDGVDRCAGGVGVGDRVVLALFKYMTDAFIARIYHYLGTVFLSLGGIVYIAEPYCSLVHGIPDIDKARIGL